MEQIDSTAHELKKSIVRWYIQKWNNCIQGDNRFKVTEFLLSKGFQKDS